MSSWKSLQDLLALAATRGNDNPVETSLHVLRAKNITLPLLVESLKEEDNNSSATTASSVASCRLCGIDSFSLGVTEQRQHFKSAWHLHNLANMQRDESAISSDEFAKLEEEDEEDEYVSSSSSGEEDDDTAAPPVEKSHFSIFSLVNSPVSARTHALACRTITELSFCLSQPTLTWGVILYRSGHFAAAVFENGKAVQHKTEHRYTTRKKQGGSQASHDTKSHKAKSAGAQLRRYGEQTMRERVSKVLAEWPQWRQCDKVYFTIPERARSLFFTKKLSDAKDGRFLKHDPRCCKIPFMTQRPTLDECERVFNVLSRVDLFVYTAPVVVAAAVEEEEAAVEATKQETQEDIELRKAKEDEARYREMGYFDRPLHVFCRDEPDGVDALIGDNDVNAKALDGSTALHIAAELGKLEFCRTLLFDLGADPAAQDLLGRVPYQLAKLPAVRMLFREFRGHRAEDEAYWRRTQIPEPPKQKTEEDVEAKREREREKRKRQAQKKREEKAAEEAKKLLPPPPPEGPLCASCSASLKGRRSKDLFKQGDCTFCSQPCMREHSRKVMAAALDRRL